MSKYFTEKDLDLLEGVLALIPDLDLVALAAKLVREYGSYPINSVTDLVGYFDKSGKLILKDDTIITYTQVERFLQKEFFPIESEKDLLCRILIAFQRGRLSHLLDKAQFSQAAIAPSDIAPTILPSPSLTVSDLIRLNQTN